MVLDFKTIKTAKKEPMLLIDTTGSMTEEAAEKSGIARLQVVGEMLPALITRLAAQDSAGAHEEGGGGIYTVTFADGRADEFGDLNEKNIQHFWDTRQWAGSTRIMPGYDRIHAHYREEFLNNDEVTEKPKLLLVIPTDGELKDERQFEEALARDADSQYVVIALIGHGRDYQQALGAYHRLEARFPNIKVLEMGGVTDGTTVAQTIMDMIS